ncbi:hypothetical protein PCE1_004241 [Barthelona sp. PCE]
MLRVRVVNFDTVNEDVQSIDLNDDTEDVEGRVVNLRIFGITEEMQRVCLHVHGYFPHFFVRLPSLTCSQTLLSTVYDRFIDICMASEIQPPHIATMNVVEALYGYGYSDRDSLFIKVSCFRTSVRSALVKALQESDTMVFGFEANVCNAHITLSQQFFTAKFINPMDFLSIEDLEAIHIRPNPFVDSLVGRSISDFNTSFLPRTVRSLVEMDIHHSAVFCNEREPPVLRANQLQHPQLFPSARFIMNSLYYILRVEKDIPSYSAVDNVYDELFAYDMFSYPAESTMEQSEEDLLDRLSLSNNTMIDYTMKLTMTQLPPPRAEIEEIDDEEDDHAVDHAEDDEDLDQSSNMFEDIIKATLFAHSHGEMEQETDNSGYISDSDSECEDVPEPLNAFQRSLSETPTDEIIVPFNDLPRFEELGMVDVVHQRPVFSDSSILHRDLQKRSMKRPKKLKSLLDAHADECTLGELAFHQGMALGVRIVDPPPFNELPPFQESDVAEKEQKGTLKARSLSRTAPIVREQTTQQHEFMDMRTVFVEIITNTKGTMPDPRGDAVVAIVAIATDDSFSRSHLTAKIFEVSNLGSVDDISLDNSDALPYTSIVASTVTAFDEIGLFEHFALFVSDHDPDVILSYDITRLGLGYLLERSESIGFPLIRKISRTKWAVQHRNIFERIEGGKPFGDQFSLPVPGRLCMCAWRIVKKNKKLHSYTFCHVINSFFGITFPEIAPHAEAAAHNTNCRGPIRRLLKRTLLVLRLFFQLDFFKRTAEYARSVGISFLEVMSRGSQYKVEGKLGRVAAFYNIALFSPSRKQVLSQAEICASPLIMEPISGFHPDPIAVFDFLSLYPTLIIAHNLCYTTSLGRVPRETDLTAEGDLLTVKLGCDSVTYSKRLLRRLLLNDELFICPLGNMYVRPSVRLGMFPAMLYDIISTRLRVKERIKTERLSEFEKKALNFKQYALKMIANVAYGYTGAGFSGRMPCVEISDSIVQLGREYVKMASDAAVSLGGRVVYGATDSLFVEFKGFSLEKTFVTAKKVVDIVNKQLPFPMCLQFENVFFPSFLLRKNRYMGVSYDHPKDNGTFKAKGVETIRRDSCPIVGKALRMVVDEVFSKKLDGISKFCKRLFSDICNMRYPLSDFMFRRRVKLGRYKKPPPVAVLAVREAGNDRDLPRYGERISFLVADHVQPGKRPLLENLVMYPWRFVQEGKTLNFHYYISKQIIPALNRVVGSLGIDVTKFYKIRRVVIKKNNALNLILVKNCENCGMPLNSQHNGALCSRMLQRNRSTRAFLHRKAKSKCYDCQLTHYADIECINVDCPIYFQRSTFEIGEK